MNAKNNQSNLIKQPSLYDEEMKLDFLDEKGDPLKKLDDIIPWDIFRKLIAKAFEKEPLGPGGRKRYDYIMMFKILVLQRYYNLSDEQTEYQLNDRISFQRFIGVRMANKIPDATTIWLFREKLIQNGIIKEIFKKFTDYLEKKYMIMNKGSIVDASFVDVPRQRNSKEENNDIKKAEIPKKWKENENKLRQKDVDARWTIKNKEKHYGYKNHIKTDSKKKIITKYEVTDASVHDSQVIENLITKKDRGTLFYGDSAYSGKPIAELLSKNNIKNRIHEKGYRGHPLTEKQKASNKAKSKIRARVEHIFGFIENSMNGAFLKSIGGPRAEGNIGLINITYNLFRYCQLA